MSQKITNCSKHNKSLINRESITFWIPEDNKRPWRSSKKTSRGAISLKGDSLSKEDKDVEVLSRYLSIKDNPPPIIECSLGEGRAIHSGVHFEFNQKDVCASASPMQKIVSEMQEQEALRKRLSSELPAYLKLEI